MAYTTIDNPELYFQVKAYTGNGTAIGSGGLAVTLDGDEDMQPDFVWLKNRSTADRSNQVYDVLRGVTKGLKTNSSDEENTSSERLTAFGSDGFTVGDNVDVNTSGDNYVAWCWKAGTAFSNDASATSVGDIDSTGSISTAAGISIMSYTGTGTADQSVAHGLGATPQFIIIKNRTTAGYWPVTNPRFVSVSDTNILYLQLTAAESDDTNINGTTAPSSTVFGVDDYGAVNTSGDAHIAYCFAPKQGYSAMGSYTGNGSTDGPFVYTGFSPAWVLVKKSSVSGSSWTVLDNKRNTFNPMGKGLFPDSAQAEYDYTDRRDFYSNGFKIRISGSAENTSGVIYTYMAFAEAPFVNSKGVPCNAR